MKVIAGNAGNGTVITPGRSARATIVPLAVRTARIPGAATARPRAVPRPARSAPAPGHLLLDSRGRLRSQVLAGLRHARLGCLEVALVPGDVGLCLLQVETIACSALRQFLVLLDTFAGECELCGCDTLLARRLLELLTQVAGIGGRRNQFRTELVMFDSASSPGSGRAPGRA